MALSKSKLGRYALLRHKKYRDKEGLFLVQGSKAVKDVAPCFEVEDLIDDTADIRKITTLEHAPEVIAVCRIPSGSGEIKIKPGNFALFLDGIQDPGNLGTIIRTAHWFGVRQLFCSKTTVDLYNPKTVLATMGSIAKVEVTYCGIEELVDSNAGLPVYGLLMDGDNIFKENNLPPGIIVMGNEGHGLRDATLKRVTKRLTIPPASADEHPDSLNVAIATAITLSQLIK